MKILRTGVWMLVLALAVAPAASAAKHVVPFIEDDYAKALAEARARKLPLFVETWAPWCHTCRSMQAYVFTDEALAPQADRFVWLSLDMEKKENAAHKSRLAVAALPSFFILDPTTEKVALRWVGSATVPQLQKILDEGRQSVAQASGGKASGDKKSAPADAALARADALYGEAKYADAAKAYQEALAAAPKNWAPYARTVESTLYALSNAKEHEVAAELARDAYPKLAKTPSAANVAGSGLASALELAPENPQRKDLVAALEKASLAVVDDEKLQIAADDISGVYIGLVEAREDAKDEAGKRAMLTRWASYLEKQAGRAPNADARAVFDSHRLSAYLELGEPGRAIPMLTASERDLPNDYNPSARLAVAYKAMEKWDDALAASDRALAKSYGPRRLGILQTRADIYKGMGQAGKARETLEGAVSEAKALPDGQRSETTIANLQKKIDALSPTDAAARP